MLSARAATGDTRRADDARVGSRLLVHMLGHVQWHMLGHLLSAIRSRITEFTRHEDVACNT
ncbi:MAG: hypothetical protein V4617_11020 [Gemmatimonadota bacterium]